VTASWDASTRTAFQKRTNPKMTSKARVSATEIRIERKHPSLLLKKKNMRVLRYK
jgi:hypothetical protein